MCARQPFLYRFIRSRANFYDESTRALIRTSAVSDCIGWNCTTACGVNLQTGLPCNMGQAFFPGSPMVCSPISVMVADPHATTSTDQASSSADKAVPTAMAAVQAQASSDQFTFLTVQEAKLVASTESSLSPDQQAALTQLLAEGPQGKVSRRALRASGGCCGAS